MNRPLVSLTCVVILLGATLSLSAQEVERITKKIDAEGAKSMEIDIDIGAGELDLSTADMAEAAKIEVYYTPRYVRYDIDYSVRQETGQMFLESSHRSRFHGDIDDLENEWTVVLSNRYPTDLKFEMGACDSRVDFGGLPLTKLDVEIGATSGFIDFSEPNPVRLEEFNLEAGASSLEVANLANANCDRMEFEIGAASCELDFRGDFKGETEIYLEVGVGSVELVVPRDLNVRVEGDDGWFSSIDFHGLDLREVDDGIWETDDFARAEDRLIINAEVAMGSIDIYARR